jgi:ribosomal protein S18 acetylase RimI-like enzyme
MLIRAYDPSLEDAVVRLWADAGLTRPWNDPRKDIARKLTDRPELFLVAVEAGVDASGAPTSYLVATAMFGYDGHRGWVHYLAVASSHRGQGLARELMAEGERLLIDAGCPKLMLMVRSSNEVVIDLYEHLDYTREDTVLLGKRLIPDQ